MESVVVVWMVVVGVLCVAAAALHGYLGETKLIAPAAFRNRQSKRLVSAIWQFSTVAWMASGLIIAASPWLFAREHLLFAVALACLPIGYGIVLNAAITRGRHFGWKILAVIVVAALFGASEIADAAPRIAFEHNLRRSIAVEGQERQRFSLSDRMRHYKVPGVSVAVIDHCRIVDARGFGLAAVNGQAVSRRTLFQAASLSKPLVAVAALKLVERGSLSLDADVAPLLRNWSLSASQFTNGQPVTLRKLLGHTAGINAEDYQGYAPGQQVPALSEILSGRSPANSAPVHVESTPGSNWNYSGPGYLITQALMTDVTGAPFAKLMNALVLRATGMHDSSFDQPLDAESQRRAARGVGPDGSALSGGWRIYPELAAAGLWTTPTDYARFMIALAQADRGDNQRLLGPASVRELMRRGLGDWGLGVDVGPAESARHFQHTGANAGFQSAFQMYPDTCQGAIVMTNADEGGWLATETLRAIGDSYGWPDRVPAPVKTAAPLTPAIAKLFVGQYRLRDFPTERFSITQTSAGGLYWARAGHVGRDLLPESGQRMFSPDSNMSIEAIELDGSRAKVLKIGFGGGTNVAERMG